MNVKLERFTPPGYNIKFEKRFIIGLLVISIFVSLGFFADLVYEYNKLFYTDGGKLILKDGAAMPVFADIVSSRFLIFTVTAFNCLIFIGIRRSYLSQTTKSIYTVKRLPERFPVFKLTVPVPVLHFLTVAFIKYALIALYLVVYLLAAPDGTLQQNYLHGIWRL